MSSITIVTPSAAADPSASPSASSTVTVIGFDKRCQSPAAADKQASSSPTSVLDVSFSTAEDRSVKEDSGCASPASSVSLAPPPAIDRSHAARIGDKDDDEQELKAKKRSRNVRGLMQRLGQQDQDQENLLRRADEAAARGARVAEQRRLRAIQAEIWRQQLDAAEREWIAVNTLTLMFQARAEGSEQERQRRLLERQEQELALWDHQEREDEEQWRRRQQQQRQQALELTQQSSLASCSSGSLGGANDTNEDAEITAISFGAGGGNGPFALKTPVPSPRSSPPPFSMASSSSSFSSSSSSSSSSFSSSAARAAKLKLNRLNKFSPTESKIKSSPAASKAKRLAAALVNTLTFAEEPPAAAKANGITKHRVSCHRCGNLRKTKLFCTSCPHVYCKRCAEKMVEEHGETVFDGGCPVCKKLCCCSCKRAEGCPRMFHCYKKCPSTRAGVGSGRGRKADKTVGAKRKGKALNDEDGRTGATTPDADERAAKRARVAVRTSA